MKDHPNPAHPVTGKETAHPAAVFYDSMGVAYHSWSNALHIHFGYYRWGMNPFNLEAMLEQMTLEVLERLAIAEGSPIVLDAGCGVGASCRFMARRAPGAIFYGVTISPWQVAFGEKINREAGLSDRVLLLEADFQKMPFPENFASAAFSIESACYGDGKGKTPLVNELARVLKPGGRLVVADGFSRQARPFSGFFEKMYRYYLSLWALEDLAHILSFEKNLQAAGFENIRVEDITWNTAPTVAHIPLVLLRMYLQRGLFQRKKMPEAQRNYMRALAMTLLMGFWKRHLGYYLVTCTKK